MEVTTTSGAPVEGQAPAIAQEMGTPPVETPADEKPKERYSTNLSALVRKEQAILRQKQALAQERAQLEQFKREREQFLSEKEQWARQQQEFRTNPQKLLDHYGLNYKQLTDYYMNNAEPTADLQVSGLRSEIQELKERQEREAQERKRLAEESEKARLQQVESQLKTNITEFVNRNTEQYEIIAANNAHGLVYDVMETHYNQTGKILSIKESADMVEEYLTEQVKKLSQARKFQQPPPAKSPDNAGDRNTPKSAPASTLTNSNTSSSTPSLLTPRVENDRMARALAALSRG